MTSDLPLFSLCQNVHVSLLSFDLKGRRLEGIVRLGDLTGTGVRRITFLSGARREETLWSVHQGP